MQPLFGSGEFSGWLVSNGIARIAVPCFFIVSGYFIHSKSDDSQALKKYLLHILIVYAIWSLIYLPTYYNTVGYRSLVTFAIMGYYHLWFLPALISGILMLAGIKKFMKNDTLILALAIILFITGYIMESAGSPYRLFCNGVFFGFPFIASGYYIRKKNLMEAVKSSYTYIILLISLITLLLESYWGYKTDIRHNLFLSLYIFCPVLFIRILKHPGYATGKDHIGKISAGIYYVHILVVTWIIPLSETNNICKLPFVAIVSVLLSIFIVLMNKRIKILL
jgi:surface polysaccharide O-acyltransferase-like enzyme